MGYMLAIEAAAMSGNRLPSSHKGWNDRLLQSMDGKQGGNRQHMHVSGEVTGSVQDVVP